jgi:multimeric flavodoxin WrbA
MRILLLNGAEESHHKAEEVCRCFARKCETQGHVVTEMVLRDMEITYWLAEYDHFYNTPGLCSVESDTRRFVKKLTKSHVVITVTPITCGGYSFDLNKVFQRSLPKKIPRLLHLKREDLPKDNYEQYHRYIAVGILPEADAEQEKRFRKLVEKSEANFNSQIVNCHVILENQSVGETQKVVEELLMAAGVEKSVFPARSKTQRPPDPTKKQAQ